jgi:hypothetical protein
METVFSNARLCHDQAERIHALATKEPDRTRQRIMFILADQYYLLHDRLVELQKIWPKRTTGAHESGDQAS